MNDWQDNIGKIVLGDCMDVLRQIPDGAVDVLLTDPPYGMPGREDPSPRLAALACSAEAGGASASGGGSGIKTAVSRSTERWQEPGIGSTAMR